MANWKASVRRMTDAFVRLIPRPLARHLLKSYYYNPELQNRVRYHIQPFRYNTPIPDFTEINLTRLSEKRKLQGIPADLTVYHQMLDRLKPFALELGACPLQKAPGTDFWFRNGGYEDFDAVTLYSMLRLVKPRRMIEVGCGHSSRVTTLAARKNADEKAPMDCLFIEPYPPPFLKEFKLSGPLRVEMIQTVPIEVFTRLEAGDVLFVDTSHVLKTQNDLCSIFLEILPALASGVFIHFHDIFTPYDYPEEWLLKTSFHYNEQYALEAILCNSRDYEILLPVHALWREHRAKLSELLPSGEVRPAAYWLRKR